MLYGYEVEPEYKVGGWVVLEDGYIGEIEFINEIEEWANIGDSKDTKERGVCLAKTYDLVDIERHATPSEIAEEKERRFWSEHGREPWQLKQGDILTKTIDGFPVIVSPHNEDYLNDFDIGGLRKQYRVACFVDDREDWEND
jgi:hypothetical protein